jgi:O-antigen ligase
MNPYTTRQELVAAAIIGFMAACSTASITIVQYGGLSYSSSADVFLGLLAMFLLGMLVYWRPLASLTLALVTVTSPIPLLLTVQQSAAITAILLAGAAIGLVFRKPVRWLAGDSMLPLVGGFALMGLVAALYGLWAGNDVAYVLGDWFQIIEFALAYFLTGQLVKERAQIFYVLRTLLISVMATILLELVLFALGPSGSKLLPSWEGASVSGSLVRTINADATILFATLLSVYSACHSGRQRFWILAALVPTVANIALSLSRGLWLCSIVAVIVSFALQGWSTRKRLFRAFGVIGVCILAIAAVWKIGATAEDNLLSVMQERVLHGVDQVQEGVAGEESMATRRFLEMVIVGPQVFTRPLFGHGLGATYVIGGFAILDAGTNGPVDHHFIHNLYLVTAFRMGLIGLGILLWLLFRYFRVILRLYKKIPSDFDRAVVVGLMASIVGQLFSAIVEPTITDHPTGPVIACLLAISIRLAKLHSTNQNAI